jgi:DNA replicative helicase MCM subunit Mcm2 (Cdc46/Mcm family)
MSECRPPSPSELSKTQKSDLQRLWEVQTRQVVGVRPTSEGASTTKASIDDGRTIQMMLRLHAFFLAFLKKVEGTRESGEELATNNTETTTTSSLIKDIRQSCLGPYGRLFLPSISESENPVRLRGGRRVFTVHYEQFMQELNHFEFKGQATTEVLRNHSFGAFLFHYPIQAIPAINAIMGLAVATLWRGEQPPITQPASSAAASTLDRFLDSSQITVRFLNVTPQHPMADIKTGMVRKFISVKGHVVKARPKRLRVATADFECQKCAEIITHAFEQGRYSLPTKCNSTMCRSKNFVLVRPTARYTNVQELRLQESQEESTSQAGRTPRQMEVELTHDLIDSCRPGDIVLLACVVDTVNSAVAAGKTGKRALETSTYKLFLQGHSITTMSESNRRDTKGGSQIVYTQQQLQSITQLCHADHRCLSLLERRAFPFDLLVRSLCPQIIGHHEVKAGILLCLLGGTPPAQSSDRGVSIRSNSHILIVGDPGKSGQR